MSDVRSSGPPPQTVDQEILAEHRAVSRPTQTTVFERDQYRCQISGCHGIQDGGSAYLLVQRLASNPSQCKPNAAENLTTRCHRCSRWLRSLPDSEQTGSSLSARLKGVDIKNTWREILEFLAVAGPATTGEIEPHVTLTTVAGVRRALYALMGLDARHAEITDQVVVRDRVTGRYGLPEQIPAERIDRGLIPVDPDRRRMRILDEIVRRTVNTLEGLVEDPRSVAAEIVGRGSNQTHQMVRRAQAFQFPFADWTRNSKQRGNTIAAVEALDVLASATETLTRQQLRQGIADQLEAQDEASLAHTLRSWDADSRGRRGWRAGTHDSIEPDSTGHTPDKQGTGGTSTSSDDGLHRGFQPDQLCVERPEGTEPEAPEDA